MTNQHNVCNPKTTTSQAAEIYIKHSQLPGTAH